MKIDPQFYHISMNLSELEVAMGFPRDGDTSSTDFLFTCNKTKSNSILPGGVDPFYFSGGTFSWNEEVKDPSECGKRFEELKELMSENANQISLKIN